MITYIVNFPLIISKYATSSSKVKNVKNWDNIYLKLKHVWPLPIKTIDAKNVYLIFAGFKNHIYFLKTPNYLRNIS